MIDPKGMTEEQITAALLKEKREFEAECHLRDMRQAEKENA